MGSTPSFAPFAAPSALSSSTVSATCDRSSALTSPPFQCVGSYATFSALTETVPRTYSSSSLTDYSAPELPADATETVMLRLVLSSACAAPTPAHVAASSVMGTYANVIFFFISTTLDHER